MVDGMTKMPEANGLEPVMVMVFPEVEYNNSAFREAEEKRRRERRQAEEFLGKGKRKAKIGFILFENNSMGCVLSTVFGIIIGFSLGCVFAKEFEVLGGMGCRPSFFAPIGGVRWEAGW